jgi:E3 ubiquitin-protein ligase MARCH6
VDIVSGAVLTAIIIISFLSLMSFADFLRAHWQQPLQDRQQERVRDQHGNRVPVPDIVANLENGADPAAVLANVLEDVIETAVSVEDAVDNGVLDFLHSHRQIEWEASSYDREIDGKHEQNDGIQKSSPALDYTEQARQLREAVLEREANRQNTQPGEDSDSVHVVIEDDDAPDVPGVLEEIEDGWQDEEEFPEDEAAAEGGNGLENIAEIRNLGPFDPALQDEQVVSFFSLVTLCLFFASPDSNILIFSRIFQDMEINVALDELLGLRGPLTALIRNLLWLIAFNATYLGIFGFFPKTVGSVAYSGILNTTLCSNLVKVIPYVSSMDENRTTLMAILSAMEKESMEGNATFKLSEIATVTLGYLTIACMVVLSRYSLVVFQKFQLIGKKLRRNSSRRPANPEMPRLHQPNNQDVNDHENRGVDGDAVGTSVVGALDTTVAIVKVGVLLFLKMFLLPLFLGFCLDVSTVHLFGHDLARRLSFAGSDLFSFILLHWVAGITFMLLVTVFLLQLREVTHPDILARVIRPQEPQPDLLGNLLHETVLTHMKRMLLSLVIYAPLLSLHIFFPVKLVLASGWESILSFFHLNLYHLLMPQMQIPLELITFHLSMLALLERYKNSIGGLQHHWMKFMCRRLGLTEYLLPRDVEGFEFVGTKQVFLPRENDKPFEVDPFLLELANKGDNIDEDFVLSNLGRPETSSNPRVEVMQAATRQDGARVLSLGTTHVALPRGKPVDEIDDKESILLPTKLGRFRLRLGDGPVIEFFREIQGEEISRPPEGWDDLGAGGAFAQGRWAWSKERKSVIEGGVAKRTPFRKPSMRWCPVGLTLRLVALLVLSWFAITCTAVVMLSAPLVVGRSFYYILRIPPKYIHDPFAFCIGAGLFFPSVSMISRSINSADENLRTRVSNWMSRFRRPPARKLLVLLQSFLLWFVIAPATFGISYEITVVKSSEWFGGEEKVCNSKSLAFSWFMGTVVLNTWSFLLYFKCFTRQFWANIGNGILEPPIEGNGDGNRGRRDELAQNDANRTEGQLIVDYSWQGNQGRVARFFRVWRSVLVDWEWETVDRTKLIDDFARPVTKQLASALVGSSLSFHLLLYAVFTMFPVEQGEVVFPLVGRFALDGFRVAMFRLCMLCHVLFQLASAFRSRIDRWFEAAHEAARDDRYLVGEVLLNYQRPETTDSTES